MEARRPTRFPEHTQGRWYVRAESLDELEAVEQKVFRCFEAGALASGCEAVHHAREQAVRGVQHRRAGTGRHTVATPRPLGRNFASGDTACRMNRASTDMGNVSQVVPAIHPYIGIDSLPALNHQREFAAHCVGERRGARHP